jgi:hypothetical protein
MVSAAWLGRALGSGSRPGDQGGPVCQHSLRNVQQLVLFPSHSVPHMHKSGATSVCHVP